MIGTKKRAQFCRLDYERKKKEHLDDETQRLEAFALRFAYMHFNNF